MSLIPLFGSEFPFEFLHSELVAFLFEEEEKEKKNAGEENRVRLAIDKPNAATKLEAIGFRVGYAVVERIAKEFPRFTTELDCMKFICKEYWSSVFRKQVDNLKTNHQGVYVVQDNKFWLLMPFSVGDQYKEISPRYLAFSCGLIRGALANLGTTSVVTAAVENMPSVKFSIHVQPKS